MKTKIFDHLIVVLVATTIFLSSQPAKSDTYTDMMELAFPSEAITPNLQAYLKSANEFGVLKLVHRVKFCVYGSDDVLVGKIEKVLKAILSDLPKEATSNLDRSCGRLLYGEKTDVIIWISHSPWSDAREVLMPYLSVSPNINYIALIDEYERRQLKAMPSVNISKDGKKISGLLILGDNNERDLAIAVFNFVIAILNPKSAIAKFNPPLAYPGDKGQPVVSEFTKRYFRLLYSQSTIWGAMHGDFSEGIRRCIKEKNC